jgi:branched-subunit amino acid ABC-type transport system permease component
MVSLLQNKSSIGLKFKAVSEDKEAAQAMGIPVYSIIFFVITLECILAMLAGFLISFDYDQSSSSGTLHLMNAYMATVLGGIYKINRIVAAAFIIGIIENLSSVYISTEYMHATVFIILIAFLLYKREGLGKLTLIREV